MRARRVLLIVTCAAVVAAGVVTTVLLSGDGPFGRPADHQAPRPTPSPAAPGDDGELPEG